MAIFSTAFTTPVEEGCLLEKNYKDQFPYLYCCLLKFISFSTKLAVTGHWCFPVITRHKDFFTFILTVLKI